MRKMNGAIPKVEILQGNIGYMQVNGVPPYDLAKEAVAAAFTFLRNTDALIIDNRGNGGGDPRTVSLYMSYLSEGPSVPRQHFPCARPGAQHGVQDHGAGQGELWFEEAGVRARVARHVLRW